MLINLFHVILYTANKERLIEFYTQTLGLVKKNPTDDIVRLYFRDGSTTVGFVQRSKNNVDEKCVEFAFQVDSVKQTVDILKERGVTFTREATKIGESLFVANFNDPDGNQLSILSYGDN